MSEIIQKAFEARGELEVLTSAVEGNKFRITGRVQNHNAPGWLMVIHNLLNNSNKQGWGVDVSRFYFLQETPAGPKLFYVWRLIFQWDDPAAAQQIVEAITTAKRVERSSVDDVALATRGSDRNVYKNGKGAVPMGSPPLAPPIGMMR